MTLHAVCPYYACNEDCCDVGCGYITSHDASMISRFCSADYKGCNKFQELQSRLDGDMDQIDEVRIPVTLPEVSTPATDNRNTAIGLIGGGIALLLYTSHKMSLFGGDIRIPALLLLLGSLLQLSAGLNAFKKRSLRGIMFIGGGLFWTSMLALDVLPAGGFGSSTAPLPMSGYFILWGFFGLVPLQMPAQVNISCKTYYGLGSLFLFMLAAGPFMPQLFIQVSHGVGLATGLCGLLASLKYLVASPALLVKLDRKKAKT